MLQALQCSLARRTAGRGGLRLQAPQRNSPMASDTDAEAAVAQALEGCIHQRHLTDVAGLFRRHGGSQRMAGRVIALVRRISSCVRLAHGTKGKFLCRHFILELLATEMQLLSQGIDQVTGWNRCHLTPPRKIAHAPRPPRIARARDLARLMAGARMFRVIWTSRERPSEFSLALAHQQHGHFCQT